MCQVSLIFAFYQSFSGMTPFLPFTTRYRKLLSYGTPWRFSLIYLPLKLGWKMKSSLTRRILPTASVAMVPRNAHNLPFDDDTLFSRNAGHLHAPLLTFFGGESSPRVLLSGELLLGLVLTSVLLMISLMTWLFRRLHRPITTDDDPRRRREMILNGRHQLLIAMYLVFVSVVHLRLALIVGVWLVRGSFGAGSTVTWLNVTEPPESDQDYWRMSFLGGCIPEILAMNMIYTMRERPRWFITPNRYKQALEKLQRERIFELNSCKDLMWADLKIEDEIQYRDLVSHKPPMFWQSIATLSVWTALGVLLFVLPQFSHIQDTLLTVSSGMDIITFEGNRRPTSTKYPPPSWFPIVESCAGVLVCLLVHRTWKLFKKAWFLRSLKKRVGLKMHKSPHNDSKEALAENESILRRFIPARSQRKALIGFTLCIALVISMGINSFLIKEVENWKRMSLGLCEVQVVCTMVSLAHKVVHELYSSKVFDNSFANLSADISTLNEVLNEMSSQLEGYSRDDSLKTGAVLAHNASKYLMNDFVREQRIKENIILRRRSALCLGLEMEFLEE